MIDWGSFGRRLRERKLVQWALAYLAGAFVLLQVLDLAAQPFAWPDLVLRAAWIVLAVGFVAALVLAWYHGERGQQRASGVELLMLAALLAIAGAGVALVAAGGDARPLADDTASGVIPDSVPDHASVVVLPFADLSPGSDQEYFSDGLTEEILNALVRIPGLRVPARTTSFAFKGRNVPVQEIARQLGVAHVLEGSVRKAGDRLRITAQLVDARNDRHLWSETYDRDLADVFAVQEEIARAVTAALEVRLARGSGPATGIVATGTADPEAYELYLRGLHAWNRRGAAALQQAAGYFEQALDRDSSFARGWTGLALTYVLMPDYTNDPADRWIPLAQHAAGRALALDSSLAEAHTALGYAHYLDWNFTESERQYRLALELNPAYATAHQWFASALFGRGRAEEGSSHMERARDLDPLSFIINANLADSYFYLRRTDDALVQYERALDLNPGNLEYRAAYAIALLAAGREDDALRLVDGLPAQPGATTDAVRAQAGYVLARTGRTAEARAIADEFDRLARERHVSPVMRAYVQVGLEQHDRVLTLLEEAETNRDPQLMYYVAYGAPAFDPIRADPRYARILERLRNR